MLDAGVKNGKLLAVIVLIICVLGIAAAFRIPVQMIPDLSVRTISAVSYTHLTLPTILRV